MLKEALRDIYAQATDRDHAHRMLVAWYQLVVDYDVAEFIRLARTLSQWEDQFLAYFETRLTNGRTEARNLVSFGACDQNVIRLRALAGGSPIFDQSRLVCGRRHRIDDRRRRLRSETRTPTCRSRAP